MNVTSPVDCSDHFTLRVVPAGGWRPYGVALEDTPQQSQLHMFGRTPDVRKYIEAQSVELESSWLAPVSHIYHKHVYVDMAYLVDLHDATLEQVALLHDLATEPNMVRRLLLQACRNVAEACDDYFDLGGYIGSMRASRRIDAAEAELTTAFKAVVFAQELDAAYLRSVGEVVRCKAHKPTNFAFIRRMLDHFADEARKRHMCDANPDVLCSAEQD